MKPLKFLGSSLNDLRSFPIEARRQTGHELWQVQMGLMPSDFKPMPFVGLGCSESRVHTRGEWRVIYVAKFESAVYVLHAFQKKSRSAAHTTWRSRANVSFRLRPEP
jgi:phage-related protein